ncbi:MAG TPA: acyloxyacyl hydrolase [Caulobacteraceae bacterium]|jgi:lipid A 3-O-deacylase|nr:acyloxyacyl hydrolase [Caulobacteraceae bacterium]
MRTLRAGGLLAIAAVFSLALPLRASADVIDEVSVTGLAHDVNDINHGKENGTADIQLEVDSARPAILRIIGAPRVNAFVALNSAGRTNSAGAGLVWDHKLFGQLYGSLDLGLAANDGVSNARLGPAGAYDRQHRLLLGSKVLFREALGLEWRLARHWAIGAEYVHQSNGQILGHGANESINDAGLKVAYRFH